MKTLAQLEEIRRQTLERITMQTADTPDQVRVVVGMATCGMAAGAMPVMMAFLTEASRRHLKNIVVSQTGCIGMCRYEPMADLYFADGQKVTYVNLDERKVRRIVTDHIVNGHPVLEFMIASKEAMDAGYKEGR